MDTNSCHLLFYRLINVLFIIPRRRERDTYMRVSCRAPAVFSAEFSLSLSYVETLKLVMWQKPTHPTCLVLCLLSNQLTRTRTVYHC